MKNVQILPRNDGFGAIYQNCLFLALYVEAQGWNYIHVPIRAMEHNIHNEWNFLEKAENTMNLRSIYPNSVKGDVEEIDTSIYEEVENNIDRYTSLGAIDRIKKAYWANKERDFFKNGKFNVAIHIRRHNTRDCRREGTDTPDSYFLYVINRLRKEYGSKNPVFHIYSQGRPEDFEIYEASDVVLHIEKDMFESFNAMVAADVLVTSPSSFSYTAALLSDGDVIYYPFWHKAKKNWRVLFDFNTLKQEKLKVDLLMCTMKFALSCDYIICGRFDGTHERASTVIDIDELNRLKNGNKLFLNGTRLEEYVDVVVNILETNSVRLKSILIGNIEPFCDRDSVFKLLPYTEDIYVSNNIIDHPHIHVLPLGLRDPEEVHPIHRNFTHNIIRDVMKDKVEKDILCLMCYRLDESSSEDRKECTRILGDKSFLVNITNKDFGRENPVKQCGIVPIDIHYAYINRSMYALCPTGYGYGTHKFFECLYLKCIPIVTRTNTPFDKLYEAFPCLIVDRWEDVDEKLLKNNYLSLFNRLLSMEVDNVLKLM